jgi:tRNA uridine 5-carboxymethylaminomethyl modification enzyme
LRAELGRVLADQVIASIETSARYAGYVDKQQEQVERSRHADRGRPARIA